MSGADARRGGLDCRARCGGDLSDGGERSGIALRHCDHAGLHSKKYAEAAMDRWLDQGFRRILPFDSGGARAYAEIAAIGGSRGTARVTRNVRDFEYTRIKVFDPWSVSPPDAMGSPPCWHASSFLPPWMREWCPYRPRKGDSGNGGQGVWRAGGDSGSECPACYLPAEQPEAGHVNRLLKPFHLRRSLARVDGPEGRHSETLS